MFTEPHQISETLSATPKSRGNHPLRITYKNLTKKQDSRRSSKRKVKQLPMTPSDDQRLISLIRINGPKFQRIQKHFKGRTLNFLKNRYYKVLRQLFNDGEEMLATEFEGQESNSRDIFQPLKNFDGLIGENHSIMSKFISKLTQTFQEILFENKAQTQDPYYHV